jgi:hypothetical protein
MTLPNTSIPIVDTQAGVGVVENGCRPRRVAGRRLDLVFCKDAHRSSGGDIRRDHPLLDEISSCLSVEFRVCRSHWSVCLVLTQASDLPDGTHECLPRSDLPFDAKMPAALAAHHGAHANRGTTAHRADTRLSRLSAEHVRAGDRASGLYVSRDTDRKQ